MKMMFLLDNFAKLSRDKHSANFPFEIQTVSDEYSKQNVALRRICKDQPATKCMKHE